MPRPRGPAASSTPVVQAERLVVGLVRGLHGLHGAVRVEPLSDAAGRFDPGSRLFVEGATRALTVDWSQTDGPGLLVRFREVTTRDGAEGLRDRYLEAEARSDTLGPDEVWWHEVLGVTVHTEAGERLGEVADVFRAGGGEVYVVRGGSRGELLIPAVRAVVRQFAPREGRLVVDAQALGLGLPARRRPRGRRSSKPGLDPQRAGGEAPGPWETSTPPGATGGEVGFAAGSAPEWNQDGAPGPEGVAGS